MSTAAEWLGVAAYLCIAIGVWIVGDWRKAGWTIGLIGNTLMVCYGMASHQEGFFLAIAAGAAQVFHLVRWRHESWRRQVRAKHRHVCTCQRSVPRAGIEPATHRF